MADARVETRSFDDPDETLSFPSGSASTVRLGDLTIGRLVLEPGWRWSDQVKPVAGTQSCQFRHVGVGLSGAGMVIMDDGTKTEIHAGEVFDIPPGHDQWVIGNEPSVSIIWGGWRGWGKPPVGDRILTTMLMTDIAGSTKRAAQLGDSAWDQLLEQHNGRVREVLDRHRGVEIDTTGDGFLAMFDGAARAVLAAVEIRGALRELDLEVRARIHTGEVEVVPGNVRGIAVHETARIMALASGGDIFVSSTTRELAGGAGLSFEDRGEHQLKGIPAPRRVFALV